MASQSFDLIDVIRIVQKNIKIILLVTIVTSLLGSIFYWVKPKKYKATARFLVNNPLYGDRITLFRSNESRWVDYFGGDDDIDKVTALASSDTVIDRIIRNSQFQIIYKMDLNTPNGYSALMSIYKKNSNFKRSENKDIELSYIAYDPVTAANVANMSVSVIEEKYRYLYTAAKENIITSISEKLHQVDSTINILTDSLAEIRDKFGIYNIISPARQNVIISEIKPNGKGFGKVIEEIQNIESIKDQLVSDRAHYISNLNEFEASKNNSMQYLKLITRATPPTSVYGPNLFLTTMTGAIVGFIFSILFILMASYYRLINTKKD